MADSGTVNCSVCWEHFSDTSISICDSIHSTCSDDVGRLFQSWIKKPSTARPQCSQTELNLRDCIRFLSKKTLEAFHDRLLVSAKTRDQAEGTAPNEREINSSRKTRPQRGRCEFIGPQHAPEVDLVHRQERPQCKGEILLREGSIHIRYVRDRFTATQANRPSCMCGEQFCYRCGHVWDRCEGNYVCVDMFGNVGQIGCDMPAVWSP